jgi:hypothetical protein
MGTLKTRMGCLIRESGANIGRRIQMDMGGGEIVPAVRFTPLSSPGRNAA